MKHLRKRIWIDRFQTLLSLRLASYCLAYQAVTWAFVAAEQKVAAAVEGVLGQQLASLFVLFLAASIVLLGFLFVCDAVRFAHRIVGPLYRFRKVIQAVTAGEELELIRLRKDDYLHDLKDEFNAMLKALEQRGAVVLTAEPAKGTQQTAVAA